jgi:hypothetical protein
MHFRSLLLAAVLLSFSAVVACSSDDDASTATPNRGPVLDSVDAPAEVSAADGIYKIPVTIFWSDPDGDAVSKLRYQVPDAKVDRTREAPNGGQDSLGVKLEIVLPATVEKKTYELLFSAFDSKGLEGEPVTKTVTLE